MYQSWIPSYHASRQMHVNLNMSYEAVGSGKGKARIVQNAGDIEYAGSDSLLKDSERKGKTDLVMFPTMAGGTVLAYNLPNCKQTLNLTRDHVVGIYNGTYRRWNDTSILDENQSCDLPDEKILVIARRDKSGTTSMFTEALTSFNHEWSTQYGVFSYGVDETTGRPIMWNDSVIHMYGKGNNGMSGLVLSLHYAIGYMAASAAYIADVPYARIQNRHGYFTLPTEVAVQAAMDSHASENLTVSLSDGDLEGAYPIAGYTYLMIYKEEMTNCDSAKELVRYAHWFMTSDLAAHDCTKKMMVPLSEKVTQRIHDEVLSTVMCQGRNMWQAVQDDIARENQKQETWILAVAITVPLFSAVLLAMLGYIIWQRYKLFRMIDSDEWDIAIEDIVFFEDKQHQSGGTSRLNGMMSLKSFVSVDDIPEGTEMLTQILQWPGKWKANVVGVRLLEVRELRHVTRPLKKTMLWMRDSVLHTNIVRFFGLTELETDRYVIGEYCSKGSMVDVLQNDKYNLNNDFKFCLAADIANGMAFLHANNVVHGSLTSSCCLIDARWAVKIADWEFCRMLTTLYPKKSPLLMLLHRGDEDKGTHAAAVRDFWVAPEIIRAEFMQAPVVSADVYSFSIILQEIYTREDPYAELADTLTPQQVVRAVCNNHLRPQVTDDIPMRVRQIMEIAWSDNPGFRPSFDQIVKMLRQSRTNRKTVLDSMMEAMEEYTHLLEDQVAERSAEVSLAKRNLETFLNDSVPQHLVPRLVNGETNKLVTGDGVQGRVYAHLGLVMLEVLGLHAALLHARPKEVLVFLNNLCAGLEGVVRRYGAYVAAVQGETQTIVTGLESETTFLDQRCTTVVHLAFDLIDFVCNMAPLTFGSQSTALSLRAGVHVGSVVTGVVGGSASKFVLLGEGVDVTRALVWCSEPGKVRVSRNVFSHLEKNLDFVSEEAGWIVCTGMEVESFWIRLRIPKKPDSVPSDHSVDSGVELEKSRPDSLGGESVDGEQGARDVIASDDVVHSRRSSGDGGARENNVYQRFLQPNQQAQNQSQQRQNFRQQQQQSHQTLSDISEEDERQNSPLFQSRSQQQQHHQHQHQHQQLQQQQQQAHHQKQPLLNRHCSQHSEQNSYTTHGQNQEYVHLIPTVTVIDSSDSQSNRRAPMIGRNVNQSDNTVPLIYNRDGQLTRVFPEHSQINTTGRFSDLPVLTGDQSGFRYIPLSSHAGTRPYDSGHPPVLVKHVQSVPFYSDDVAQQHKHAAGYANQSLSHGQTVLLYSPNSPSNSRPGSNLSELRHPHVSYPITHRYSSYDPFPRSSNTHQTLPSFKFEIEETETTNKRKKVFSCKSPERAASPVASTSFVEPPSFPELLSPPKLNTPGDMDSDSELHKDEQASGDVREDLGTSLMRETSLTMCDESPKNSGKESHVEENEPSNDSAKSSKGKHNSPSPGSSSVPSSSDQAGKGKGKKSNKIYPSRKK